MKTKQNCDVCGVETSSLTQAKLKVYTSKGWEEHLVKACKSCMVLEGLVEFKEEAKAA